MELYLLHILYYIYCTVLIVLYLLCCTYCTVIIVPYLLYYTYCSVLTILYCIYYTCFYSVEDTIVIVAQYNISVFPKVKQGAKYA
jgi:hypothetical protein